MIVMDCFARSVIAAARHLRRSMLAGNGWWDRVLLLHLVPEASRV
jgi:hypothetical protein